MRVWPEPTEKIISEANNLNKRQQVDGTTAANRHEKQQQQQQISAKWNVNKIQK